MMWRFIIIVIAIGFVVLIGTFLFKSFNNSIQENAQVTMISKIKSSVNEMSFESYGATKIIEIRPKSNVNKLCFIYYEAELSPDPNTPEINDLVNEIKTSGQKENLIVLTDDEMSIYYVGDIIVEPKDMIYCVEAKNKMTFELKSQGKNVLIKEK